MRKKSDELQLGSVDTWPPPGYGAGSPPPARRRMPAGWKPDEEFDYLLVRESFTIGGRYFGRGQTVIRRDDPLALKVLYECPEWVHVVRKNDGKEV